MPPGLHRIGWEQSLSGDEPVGIPWIVVLAFTRLLTHPTICARPMTTVEVHERVDTWLGQPHVRVLCPSPGTMHSSRRCPSWSRPLLDEGEVGRSFP
jgi:predicted nucleic acid-binding protein